jgi:hypothetical protein
LARLRVGVFHKGGVFHKREFAMIGLSETISVLNLFLNVYKSVRERRSPQPTDPDPDKVERVIKGLELKLEDQIQPAQDAVAKEIAKSLPPEQAQTLQRDLDLVEFLAGASKPDEYDYWSVLRNHVTQVQRLAFRAQLFLSHGRRLVTGIPTLELKKTSQFLLTPKVAIEALCPDVPYLSASPTAIHVALRIHSRNPSVTTMWKPARSGT